LGYLHKSTHSWFFVDQTKFGTASHCSETYEQPDERTNEQ